MFPEQVPGSYLKPIQSGCYENHNKDTASKKESNVPIFLDRPHDRILYHAAGLANQLRVPGFRFRETLAHFTANAKPDPIVPHARPAAEAAAGGDAVVDA